jgi:hypothetical protein
MEFEYNNLDDEWITEFDKTDKLYKDFYKDDLYYINLTVIYINKENEIHKMKCESILLNTPNQISYEEIFEILKKNSIDNEKKYTLLSILKYNISLEPDEIKVYLKHNTNNKYLSVIKNIDTIKFDKSINMFHDLNDLILIFYEKSEVIIKKHDSNSNPNSNASTKKVYLRCLTTHKKTFKNRYKD